MGGEVHGEVLVLEVYVDRLDPALQWHDDLLLDAGETELVVDLQDPLDDKHVDDGFQVVVELGLKQQHLELLNVLQPTMQQRLVDEVLELLIAQFFIHDRNDLLVLLLQQRPEKYNQLSLVSKQDVLA